MDVIFAGNYIRFKMHVETDNPVSILIRSKGATPGFGLADNLINNLAPGFKTKLKKGDGTDITGFENYDFRSGGSRSRLISNFAIYPKNRFAVVNIDPGSKIVLSTEEQIAQGSNNVTALDHFYYILGDIKEIYKTFLDIRNQSEYPVMLPKYEFFGVGWEAWGALGWNTNHKTVVEDVTKYLDLGYPLSWMVVGSGFWERSDPKYHATTSFGVWDNTLYPFPDKLRNFACQNDLKLILGLRISFIKGGPFTDEGLRKGYFITEADTAKVFNIAFPKSPIYLLDTQNPEAIDWYINLCRIWDVDGFKEDLFGYNKYVLRDDKLNQVNEALMEMGFLVMGRNNYLGSNSDIHRIEDFNYDQDQDRGAINTLAYAYSGIPFTYGDIIGGTFGGRKFENEVSPRIKEYMMRISRWSALHCSMAMGKGPWHFKDPEMEKVVLESAKLHDRLQPYLYSQAVRFYHDGFPWTQTPLTLAFPEDDDVYGRENNVVRGYQWMIGDALMAVPLFGEDYETAQSRDVYLPKGKWMDYDSGKKFEGPVLLENYALPVDKNPLFVGGTGILIEKEKEGLVARIYPVTNQTQTIFWDCDAITKSEIKIDDPDWNNPVILDLDNSKPVEVKKNNHAWEFELKPGRDYLIK